MDSYNRGPQAPQNRGARSPPSPPGRGWGAINHGWQFHLVCGLQIKKVTAIDEVPGTGTRWYQVVSDWYQDGIRLVRGIALY